MSDDYTTLLGALKTWLSHHGRGVTLVHGFDLFPFEGPLPGEVPTEPSLETAAPGSVEVSQEPAATRKPPPRGDDEPPTDNDPPPYNYDEPQGFEDEVDFGFTTDPAQSREPEPARPDLAHLDMTNITMEDLRSFWKECLGCKLGSTRKNMVFGEGAVPARIFFIGEGPGAQEDEQGRPFVGKAGQLLDRMIEAMGLTRDQIYIGNIVKCRPPGNRDPETDEMLSCMPVLERQIELVRPEVIVSLGRISAQVLLSTTRSLSKLRGSWHTYGTIPLLATYHPAYLLRNPAAKKAAWEDLQMVMKQLNLAGNT